jgi:diacylglycerol kinase family enzyme
MMLIANMPFLGPRFQISPKVSFKDSHLDVFTFSDMSKLNMISYAMLSQLGRVEDIGIQHYRVKHVKIRSIPHMPVLADGLLLGEGSLSVHIHPRALTVMAGSALTRQLAISELLEKAEPILQAALPQEQPNLFHPSQRVTNEDAASKRANPD